MLDNPRNGIPLSKPWWRRRQIDIPVEKLDWEWSIREVFLAGEKRYAVDLPGGGENFFFAEKDAVRWIRKNQ